MAKYICELCKKDFAQKIDFTRHQNKKTSCISLNQLQEIAQTNQRKMNTQASLVQVFKNCLNILRDEGLTGEKALRNMSYLLILKLVEPRLGEELDLDNYAYDMRHVDCYDTEEYKNGLLFLARFSNLCNVKEDDIKQNLQDLWEDILSAHPSTNKIFLPGKTFDIQHQTTYKRLIEKLSSIDLNEIEYDVLGNSYEEVIKDIMTGKVFGQFFTQPLVKKLMVKMINPQVHPDGKIDTCGDPTMGTGGFLITYLDEIQKQAKLKNIELDWNFIKDQGIYGKEIEPDTYQLAVSNMLISTGHMFDKLDRGDSIREPINRKFDNMLANPPFGIKGLKYETIKSLIREQYIPIVTDNAVSMFIQAIVYMLNLNGKCAVVLPDGQDLFSKTDTKLVAVREYLMKTCDLKEIVYLPAGAFTNTSIKTCVFYFVKKREGVDVVEFTKDTNKKGKISREYKFSKTHQTHKVKFYKCDMINNGTELSEKILLVEVPIEKIMSNSYSLNYAEYMKEESEEQYGEGIVMKTLGEVFGEKNNNFININDNTKYNIIGLSSKGYSKISKQIFGNEIKIKRQQICKLSQFALSKILNGCYGYIDANTADGIISNEYWLFSINTNIILKDYLYRIFDLQIMPQLKKISNGVGIPRIDKEKFYKLKIPIPSLERQQEIVKYLDFIYEKANKTSNEKIVELKKLNEFCLNHQKIFGENVVKTLGEVCNIQNGKRIVKGQVETGEYPVLGGGGFTSFYTNEYSREGKTCKISREGMSLHNCVMLLNEKYYLNSQAFTIKSKNESIMMNEYLWYYLDNNKEQVFKCGRGTAQKAIDIDEFKSLKIPIPSLERQQEIVKYCEFNDSLIKQLEQEIENNKNQAILCMNSILRVQTVNENVTEETDLNTKAEEDEEEEHAISA